MVYANSRMADGKKSSSKLFHNIIIITTAVWLLIHAGIKVIFVTKAQHGQLRIEWV